MNNKVGKVLVQQMINNSGIKLFQVSKNNKSLNLVIKKTIFSFFILTF